MAEIPENASAALAKTIATCSNLSEEQRFLSKDKAYIESILNNTFKLENNPQDLKRILELKHILTNLASTQGLSESVRNCLNILMPKVDKLCKAEEASKSSPADSTLIDNVRKIKACVDSTLTKLQSKNHQGLTKDRVDSNYYTQMQETVGSTAKAILQS